MTRWLAFAGVAAFVGLVIWFTVHNGGQRITLDLGFARFYRFPVTMVAFAALLVGMLVMLLAGLHTDLRVRKILRDRLIEEARAEGGSDLTQHDLFDAEDADGGENT
ncbi:MAG: hypothetical protein OXE73_05190 [Gammaproteobacteria bacterium]|nr:hypothetical protein [Gammaproteobacteria bacterium]